MFTFLTPPVAGALFLAALVANCLRGALPPVDLRAVCFVRAILLGGRQWICKSRQKLEEGRESSTESCPFEEVSLLNSTGRVPQILTEQPLLCPRKEPSLRAPLK